MFLKFRQHLIVQGHLIPTHGAPIGGIKGQDDRIACELTERQVMVRPDPKREIGRARSTTSAVLRYGAIAKAMATYGTRH